MAQHEDSIEIGSGAVDYGEHVRTYRSFLRAVRYAIAGIALILIFLAWVSY